MKTHSVYICQQCSYESAQWMGKCPNCGTWNSLVETLVSSGSAKGSSSRTQRSNRGETVLRRLPEIKEISKSRISTGIEEFDRVLGGGIVEGSVILLAGDPGIGKSTLLLQAAANIAGNQRIGQSESSESQNVRKSENQTSVIYVSGEESPEQIKIRADRLGIKAENLYFLNETDVDVIIEEVSQESRVPRVPQVPREEDTRDTRGTSHSRGTFLVVVDSIQTLYTADLTGTAGSVGQVRECAGRLLNYAKSNGIPMLLIGHVTKEGTIAGPMVLAHLVDTVLFFEGERFQTLRVLRAIKNRFGPTDEVGVFEMGDAGLREVTNPSDIFLGEKEKNVSGSVITALMEGSRPLLVEIQALAVQSQLAIPRRVGQGIDNNRLQLLTAVLARRAGLPLYNFDIFVNVAGGIRLTEPAADLAICLAIASAFRDVPLDNKLCAIGEVGLLGEVRGVGGLEKRIKEAKRLGFTNVVSANTSRSLRELIKGLLK